MVGELARHMMEGLEIDSIFRYSGRRRSRGRRFGCSMVGAVFEEMGHCDSVFFSFSSLQHG